MEMAQTLRFCPVKDFRVTLWNLFVLVFGFIFQLLDFKLVGQCLCSPLFFVSLSKWFCFSLFLFCCRNFGDTRVWTHGKRWLSAPARILFLFSSTHTRVLTPPLPQPQSDSWFMEWEAIYSMCGCPKNSDMKLLCGWRRLGRRREGRYQSDCKYWGCLCEDQFECCRKIWVLGRSGLLIMFVIWTEMVLSKA